MCFVVGGAYEMNSPTTVIWLTMLCLQEDGRGMPSCHPHGAHSADWLQSDASVALAVGGCIAADVKCKVIPVGPLPSSEVGYP